MLLIIMIWDQQCRIRISNVCGKIIFSLHLIPSFVREESDIQIYQKIYDFLFRIQSGGKFSKGSKRFITPL